MPSDNDEGFELPMIRLGCCLMCATTRLCDCLQDQEVTISLDDTVVWTGKVDSFLNLFEAFLDYFVGKDGRLRQKEDFGFDDSLKRPIRFRFVGVDNPSRMKLVDLFSSHFSEQPRYVPYSGIQRHEKMGMTF